MDIQFSMARGRALLASSFLLNEASSPDAFGTYSAI